MAIEKFKVNRDDEHYEAWPDVVLTDKGKLICVFTECQHHGCRDFSRLVTVESADRGRTWSAKKPLTEVCMKDNYFNNARISKVGERLAIVADKVAKNEDEYSEIWIWYGDGEGENFGEPEVHKFRGIVPDKLRVLRSGRFILAAHFKNHDTGKLEQYLWYSDDGGKSWSDRVTVAADERYNLCEACILECKDGTLVAFMRENSLRGYDCFKAISEDGGETWRGPFNAPLPGCHRPVAGFLPSGNILIAYRYLPGIGKDCFSASNVFLGLFDEEAAKSERRKEPIRTMPLDYDRSRSSDTGYTGFVTFPDGEIYLVNYIVDDAPKGQIRGYSFREEDFYL
ncbi:MAG: exo-alpha-sialidase [Clostridia bacterium]|nr:exo-alpha-sialidase [Clostridia bacterium]